MRQVAAILVAFLLLGLFAGCPDPALHYRRGECLTRANDPPASLLEPRSVIIAQAPDGQEAVIVSDYASNRILTLSPTDGSLLAVMGPDLDSLGSLNGPIGVAAYYPSGDSFSAPSRPDFRLYVCDSRNHRIVEFDSSGAVRWAWGAHGTGDGQFNVPTGVALDYEGRVYVVDSGNNRIQVFDTTGSFLNSWGGTGSDPGQFRNPIDVTVGFNSDGSTRFVAVSDHGNSRVQVFTPTGELIRVFTGLKDVHGLGTWTYGYTEWVIAVSSSTKLLHRLHVDSGTTGCRPLTESVIPYDVAVDYYVTDIGTGLVCAYFYYRK
jgi:hypothetical protein